MPNHNEPTPAELKALSPLDLVFQIMTNDRYRRFFVRELTDRCSWLWTRENIAAFLAEDPAIRQAVAQHPDGRPEPDAPQPPPIHPPGSCVYRGLYAQRLFTPEGVFRPIPREGTEEMPAHVIASILYDTGYDFAGLDAYPPPMPRRFLADMIRDRVVSGPDFESRGQEKLLAMLVKKFNAWGRANLYPA